MQCSAVQCCSGSLQCSNGRDLSQQCLSRRDGNKKPLQAAPPIATALHRTIMNCTYSITLYCTALHCFALYFNCTAQQFPLLHCTTNCHGPSGSAALEAEHPSEENYVSASLATKVPSVWWLSQQLGPCRGNGPDQGQTCKKWQTAQTPFEEIWWPKSQQING